MSANTGQLHIEAKKAATNPAKAEAHAKAYARQLRGAYIFLANGDEVSFGSGGMHSRVLSRPSSRKATSGATLLQRRPPLHEAHGQEHADGEAAWMTRMTRLISLSST